VQPEALRVVARTRSGWEAVDLGFAMARAWWRAIWGAWCLGVLPVGLALIVALRGHPWWTILALWWLRPLFGRLVLHVLGVALFAAPPSPVATLRAAGRWLGSGAVRALTLSRLSPARAYVLPVSQLEGLRGQARRERERVIVRADLGVSAMVHSIGAHLVGAIMLAIISFIVWLAPGELLEDLAQLFSGWLTPGSSTAGLVVAGLYLAAISVVEPLIGAAGFALYVNRRIWLEGWDIELAFRGLARRHAPSLATGALVACMLLSTLGAAPLHAAPSCVPGDPTTAGTCAAEVLGSDEFGYWEEVEAWQLRETVEFAPIDWGWQGARALGDFVAGLAEVLLWIGVAVLLVFVVVRASRRPPAPDPPASAVLPTRLFGLELDRERLPADVVREAHERFRAGDAIGALSLIYRGALVRVIEGHGIAVPESATEGECMRLLRERAAPDLVADFAALNDAWILSRYAHEVVPLERFDELCRRWAPRLAPEGA